MLTVKERAKYYLVFISAVILVSSVVYDYGMRTFEPGPYPPEGVEFSLLFSMQFVVETFTATGYGSHSPWISTEMQTLVMLLDVTGVAVFFLALPAVFIPVFRRLVSTSVPGSVDEGTSDHVVICTYTERSEALIQELEANDVGYVLMEPEREEAVELLEDGREVVRADPESVSGLRRANVSEARAVVADVSDKVDASIVLASKEAAEDVRVVSVVEEAGLADYHRLAGADAVLSPREVIGESLAAKLTASVGADGDTGIRVSESLEIAEIPIHVDSDLSGKTLAESDVRDTYGVNVIGAWRKGEFRTPPDPDTELELGTILLVAGTEESLEELREATATVRRHRRGNAVIVGYGEGGRRVAEELDSAGIGYTVVDSNETDGVDVVGDATDPETLREAGVEDARSVILALPDDTTTEFTTLVARDLNEDVEILARVRTSEAVGKTYRAGAEYVLSIEAVSGRSVASEVLDEEVLSLGTNVDIVRTEAPGLVGETIEGARIRRRTGCTVVAVERGGETTTIGPGFRIQEGDELVVAGTDEGTNRFVETFG